MDLGTLEAENVVLLDVVVVVSFCPIEEPQWPFSYCDNCLMFQVAHLAPFDHIECAGRATQTLRQLRSPACLPGAKSII